MDEEPAVGGVVRVERHAIEALFAIRADAQAEKRRRQHDALVDDLDVTAKLGDEQPVVAGRGVHERRRREARLHELQFGLRFPLVGRRGCRHHQERRGHGKNSQSHRRGS